MAEADEEDYICAGCIAEMIIGDELVFAGIDPDLAVELANRLTVALIDAGVL